MNGNGKALPGWAAWILTIASVVAAAGLIGGITFGNKMSSEQATQTTNIENMSVAVVKMQKSVEKLGEIVITLNTQFGSMSEKIDDLGTKVEEGSKISTENDKKIGALDMLLQRYDTNHNEFREIAKEVRQENNEIKARLRKLEQRDGD